jgi:hypothetical protein
LTSAISNVLDNGYPEKDVSTILSMANMEWDI